MNLYQSCSIIHFPSNEVNTWRITRSLEPPIIASVLPKIQVTDECCYASIKNKEKCLERFILLWLHALELFEMKRGKMFLFRKTVGLHIGRPSTHHFIQCTCLQNSTDKRIL